MQHTPAPLIAIVAITLALTACNRDGRAPTSDTKQPEPPPSPTALVLKLNAQADKTCPQGSRFYAPGCGTNPVPYGCYAFTTCASDQDCPPSSRCADITDNPCHNMECQACGSHSTVCVDKVVADAIRAGVGTRGRLDLPTFDASGAATSSPKSLLQVPRAPKAHQQSTEVTAN